MADVRVEQWCPRGWGAHGKGAVVESYEFSFSFAILRGLFARFVRVDGVNGFGD